MCEITQVFQKENSRLNQKKLPICQKKKKVTILTIEYLIHHKFKKKKVSYSSSINLKIQRKKKELMEENFSLSQTTQPRARASSQIIVTYMCEFFFQTDIIVLWFIGLEGTGAHKTTCHVIGLCFDLLNTKLELQRVTRHKIKRLNYKFST